MVLLLYAWESNRRYITLAAAIDELLGQSARTSWSSRSKYHLLVVTIMQMDRKQKANHIFCGHNRVVWTECEA